MAHKKIHRRSLDQIMRSDYVLLWEEAWQRYPLTPQRLSQLAKEGRINCFGSPRVAKCSHIEKQMEHGFPVIEQQISAT
jgi:hypothetical protein